MEQVSAVLWLSALPPPRADLEAFCILAIFNFLSGKLERNGTCKIIRLSIGLLLLWFLFSCCSGD
jgi:hypothetical protein